MSEGIGAMLDIRSRYLHLETTRPRNSVLGVFDFALVAHELLAAGQTTPSLRPEDLMLLWPSGP